MNDDITLRIMDEDVTSDDFVSNEYSQFIYQVGMAVIKVSALCINGGVRDWFTINYKNKPAGSVL